MNIRVDLTTPIKDGTEVVFRSPVDCSQITGLIVYVTENGNTTSQEFALADAHGNNVGDIDHLFAENVVVKVILDVAHSMAFVQNADTNAYLEGRFADIIDKFCPTVTESGYLLQFSPFEGTSMVVACEVDNVVTICGKNLYDRATYQFVEKAGYVRIDSGVFYSNANYRVTDYIPVAHLEGKTINLSHIPGGTSPGMAFYRYLPIDDADVKVACIGGGKGNNIEVPSGASYMRFTVNAGDADADIQIELGSAFTGYERYTDKTVDDHLTEYPIETTALNGTNTVFCLREYYNTFVDSELEHRRVVASQNVTVTYKADPTALITKLMQTVFPKPTMTIEEE